MKKIFIILTFILFSSILVSCSIDGRESRRIYIKDFLVDLKKPQDEILEDKTNNRDLYTKIGKLNSNNSDLNDEDISDTETKMVIKADTFVGKNEDVLVKIELYNSKNYVINSIKINDVFYNKDNFLDNSTFEVIYLNINSGNIAGIVELILEEVTYINEYKETREAKFPEDEATASKKSKIILAVDFYNLPEAKISKQIVTPSVIKFDLLITDELKVIDGPIVLKVYNEDQREIYNTDLKVGVNNIEVTNLLNFNEYRFEVTTIFYEYIGVTVEIQVLLDVLIETSNLLNIDIITDGTTVTWDAEFSDDTFGYIYKIELYKNRVLVEDFEDLTKNTIENLELDTNYTLLFTYKIDPNNSGVLVEYYAYKNFTITE